jgi:hypothetical protein
MFPDDRITDAVIALNRTLSVIRLEQQVGSRVLALEDARILCVLILNRANAVNGPWTQQVVERFTLQLEEISTELERLRAE